MIGRHLQACAAAFGSGAPRLALGAVALGVAAVTSSALAGDATAAFGVLASCWLFFAGVAAGSVAFSAAVRVSQGRWAEAVLPLAEAGAAFFPAAWAVLAVLVLAARAWIPGAAEAGFGEWCWRAVGLLGSAGALFVAGATYVRHARSGASRETSAWAVVYLLAYAGALSVWAVRLVMDLRDWAPSTVIPPLYFGGAFLSGIAWTTLLAAVRREQEWGPATRQDLGKLLFAFCIFWGYLVWSAYLPVWYADLPDETGQLIARWGSWRYVSLAVLGLVLVFPFVYLLPARAKRGRVAVAVAAAVILVGLFGERFLLVLPSLSLSLSAGSVASGVGVALGMLGAFVLAVGAKVGGRPGATAPSPSAR